MMLPLTVSSIERLNEEERRSRLLSFPPIFPFSTLFKCRSWSEFYIFFFCDDCISLQGGVHSSFFPSSLDLSFSFTLIIYHVSFGGGSFTAV